MRRLLSLILVLGLASSANADLFTQWGIEVDGSQVGSSIDVVTGGTISVEVINRWTDPGAFYLNFEDNGLYTLSNPQITTNAGDQGGYYGPYTYGGYDYYTVNIAGSGISAGTVFLVDFTAGSSTGTVDVILQDFEGTVTVRTLTINIVPEPMTITLFALGGIAMLRKRK